MISRPVIASLVWCWPNVVDWMISRPVIASHGNPEAACELWLSLERHTDTSPTWVQHFYNNRSHQTQNICITFIQRRPWSHFVFKCKIVIQMFCVYWVRSNIVIGPAPTDRDPSKIFVPEPGLKPLRRWRHNVWWKARRPLDESQCSKLTLSGHLAISIMKNYNIFFF